MKKNIKNALTGLNATETPQGLPIPGRDMVENNAGGFVFKLDEWKQLERFLILGSEGGTFYVSEKKLTAENANKVLLLLQKDGLKVVAKTVEMLTSGRAPKPDTAIFVLALAAAKGDDATRKAALAAVPSALKTGTQLLKFVDTVNELRGWGRGLKKAIQLWFKGRKAETLALQLVKYKQREGWSMKDVLRLAKPVPADDVQGKLFGWTAKRDNAAWAKAPVAPGDKALDFVWAAEQASGLRLVAENADTAEAKAILAEANQASVKKHHVQDRAPQAPLGRRETRRRQADRCRQAEGGESPPHPGVVGPEDLLLGQGRQVGGHVDRLEQNRRVPRRGVRAVLRGRRACGYEAPPRTRRLQLDDVG